MNKKQKEFLAYLTCGILEKYEDIDTALESHGIPKYVCKKIVKAFDLIAQVNQLCFDKSQNVETEDSWVFINSQADLPDPKHRGQVEFKPKESNNFIVGYYDDVYKTFEDDETIRGESFFGGWGEVERYRLLN